MGPYRGVQWGGRDCLRLLQGGRGQLSDLLKGREPYPSNWWGSCWGCAWQCTQEGVGPREAWADLEGDREAEQANVPKPFQQPRKEEAVSYNVPGGD